MLQNLERSVLVIGWIVEGWLGSKYNLLTQFLFCSVVANGLSLCISFPFSTLRFLKYLHQAGRCSPLEIASTASWILSVPGFINKMCLLSLEIGVRGTTGALFCFRAVTILSTRVWACSSAVLHRGVDLFSHCASARTSSLRFFR